MSFDKGLFRFPRGQNFPSKGLPGFPVVLGAALALKNFDSTSEVRGTSTELQPQRRITLAGTSLLLPGNPAWQALGEHYQLVFGEFAEWSSLLLNPSPSSDASDTLVLVVFLQDVISSDQLSSLVKGNSSPQDIDDLLAPLLMAIDCFTSRSSNRLIVAWSNAHSDGVVESARRIPPWELISSALEARLRQRQTQSKTLFLLPLDRFFAEAGRESCFDARNYYAAHCRLSQRGITTLAKKIAELTQRFFSVPKKVLVLDCDNTLWGGVLGEDGLVGIRLGQDGAGAAYADFQRAVRNLQQKGTLLALVSKNDEALVWQAFDEHPSMVLRRSDIVASRINWKEKSDNLAELSEELGLALDSFVFWDDNPLEREALRARLPDVTVADVPREVWHWPGWLESSNWFASFENTTEDFRRIELYQSRAKFHSESSQFRGGSEHEFLRSIHLRPTVVPISEALISRAAQLANKTNQFNLRTRRYDESAIREIALEKKNLSFLVHLQDKFGDHGNVGLVIARSTSNHKVVFLDTFLLSCRVLGRHLEAWMLDQCIKTLRANQVDFLLAEFVPTERNQVAANFLEEHGFSSEAEWGPDLRTILEPLMNKNDGHFFALDCAQATVPHMDIYAE
ncbi:MAG: HAD-IIIC family phosphatase [Terriglobales bacterium]